METVEQTTLPRYTMEFIDKETGKAMEYLHLTKHDNKYIW